MNSVVLGIGTALPQGTFTQEEAADAAYALRGIPISTIAGGENGQTNGGRGNFDRRVRLMRKLYQRSAVDKRHSVLLASGDGEAIERQSFFKVADDSASKGPGTDARMQQYTQHAPQLAANACRDALTRSGCDAADIQHLITISCSGFSAPGFDLSLFESLGLNTDVTRTHIGFMGCYAALSGMRVADSLARANPGEKVLVCAVEICTLHHQYTDDPQEIVANSLFADGAAAMLISAKEPESISEQTLNLEIVAQKSAVMPDSAEMMTWRIGDHGFQMTLSPKVPEVIQQHLKPWLEDWLSQFGLSVSSIDHWAIHPGGPRILSASAKSLEIERECLAVSDKVLAENGNMSSPTLLFILRELIEANKTGTCVALAFGPGLVIEAALLRATQ